MNKLNIKSYSVKSVQKTDVSKNSDAELVKSAKDEKEEIAEFPDSEINELEKLTILKKTAN